jgi:hypothetical protein
MSLNCGLQRAYRSSPKLNEYGQPRWNDTDRGQQKNSDKNPSQCHFFTTNPTWTDWGTNPGLRRKRPAANSLSQGIALSYYVVYFTTNFQ